jgi:hypothetical protein
MLKNRHAGARCAAKPRKLQQCIYARTACKPVTGPRIPTELQLGSKWGGVGVRPSRDSQLIRQTDARLQGNECCPGCPGDPVQRHEVSL